MSSNSFKKKYLIAITGRSGAGKSCLIKFISEQGYNTLDLDQFVHGIYQKEQQGYKLIQKNFGKNYVSNDAVNRAKLGQLVFSDYKFLLLLNSLIFPLVKEKLESLQGLWYVEMAALINYQEDFSNFFSKVILVKANSNDLQARTSQKFPNVKKFSTTHVENSNNPILSSKIKADWVVENTKSIGELEQEAIKITTFFATAS